MQLEAVIPDLNRSRAISKSAEAGGLLCWACSACDSECPVFRSTNRLRPQKNRKDGQFRAFRTASQITQPLAMS